MFFRRADFLAVGGCDPTLLVMEEADLCIRFHRLGRTRLVNRVVITSDRRIPGNEAGIAVTGRFESTRCIGAIAIAPTPSRATTVSAQPTSMMTSGRLRRASLLLAPGPPNASVVPSRN